MLSSGLEYIRTMMKVKRDMRRAAIRRRDGTPAHEIRRRSAAAGSHLFALPDFTSARLVMFFVSFGSEIDTLPMIREALAMGKRVAAPRVERNKRSLIPCEITDSGEDLTPGAYGIREPRLECPPVNPAEIDVVVVPAVIWDENGYRVGYGGGYYDRFLARLRGARRIGLGMEMQIVPEVPHGPRDLAVDVLVTDARVRHFSQDAEADPCASLPNQRRARKE
jgi:5-formyltetrahydrofolate cyclo-ligase